MAGPSRITRRAVLASVPMLALAAKKHPVRKARVEPLWKSPGGHPNALEASPEGLWVGEQVSDRAYLLDWTTGKVLRSVETESSNTSGIAYGGGYIWMAANGPASRRPPRPTDTKDGEVHKVDAATGKTVARYPVPGGGGVHGLTWANDSQPLHSIPITLDRAHGIAADGDSIWCMFSNDYLIQRLDARDGRVIEAIQLKKGSDPDPHGMTMHRGVLYYSDSGFVRGGGAHQGKYGGYICRIHL